MRKTFKQRLTRSILGAAAIGTLIASPNLVTAQESDSPIERRLSPGDTLDAAGALDRDATEQRQSYGQPLPTEQYENNQSTYAGPTLYQDREGRRFYQDGDGTRYYQEQNQPIRPQRFRSNRFMRPEDVVGRTFNQLNRSLGNVRSRFDGQSTFRIPQPNDGRPMLGIGISAAESGVMVDAVRVGSVADRAGIQPGDVITQANGKQLSDPQQLQDLISPELAGKDVNMTIMRGDTKQQVTASFPKSDRYTAAKPGNSGDRSPEAIRRRIDRLQAQLDDLRQQLDEAQSENQSQEQSQSQANSDNNSEKQNSSDNNDSSNQSASGDDSGENNSGNNNSSNNNSSNNNSSNNNSGDDEANEESSNG